MKCFVDLFLNYIAFTCVFGLEMTLGILKYVGNNKTCWYNCVLSVKGMISIDWSVGCQISTYWNISEHFITFRNDSERFCRWRVWRICKLIFVTIPSCVIWSAHVMCMILYNCTVVRSHTTTHNICTNYRTHCAVCSFVVIYSAHPPSIPSSLWLLLVSAALDGSTVGQQSLTRTWPKRASQLSERGRTWNPPIQPQECIHHVLYLPGHIAYPMNSSRQSQIKTARAQPTFTQRNAWRCQI